jgi:hypothetical protein
MVRFTTQLAVLRDDLESEGTGHRIERVRNIVGCAMEKVVT